MCGQYHGGIHATTVAQHEFLSGAYSANYLTAFASLRSMGLVSLQESPDTLEESNSTDNTSEQGLKDF